MSAYWQVTDDILQQILRLNLRDYITRDADNIMAAQTLITNIFRRMLYPTIGITESRDGVVKVITFIISLTLEYHGCH